MTIEASKTIDHLRIDDTELQNVSEKMEELNILKANVDLKSSAKSIIEELSKDKLADFVEKQFKSGENRKSYQEMVSTPFYSFAVQAALDALGYDDQLGGANFGVDGKYGSRTIAAVEKFQEDLGLEKDGLVGEATFAALVARLKDSLMPEGPVSVDQSKVFTSDPIGNVTPGSSIDKKITFNQSKITLALDSAKRLNPSPDNLGNVLPPVVWNDLTDAEKQEVKNQYIPIYKKIELIENAQKDIKEIYSGLKTNNVILTKLDKYFKAQEPVIDSMLVYYELNKKLSAVPSRAIMDAIILRPSNTPAYLSTVDADFRNRYGIGLSDYITKNYGSYWHNQIDRQRMSLYQQKLKHTVG